MLTALFALLFFSKFFEIQCSEYNILRLNCIGNDSSYVEIQQCSYNRSQMDIALIQKQTVNKFYVKPG